MIMAGDFSADGIGIDRPSDVVAVCANASWFVFHMGVQVRLCERKAGDKR